MPKLSELLKLPKPPVVASWMTRKDMLDKLFPNAYSPYAGGIKDDKTFIGIEVEVEQLRHMRAEGWDHLWEMTEDGSLRNSGREFVSRAIKGEQIPYALITLAKCLEDTVEFSHRTSVHVHINIQDLTPEEIAKIILCYLTVEKQLFDFAGKVREKNIFCVPLYNLGMTDGLFRSVMNLDTKQMKTLQSEHFRYSALNLEPVTKYGTLEFRHLGGTIDTTRIMLWINLLLDIKKYALSKDMDSLIKEIIDLNTNSQYRAYLYRIIGSAIYSLDMKNIDDNIEAGVISVKRALFSDGFLHDLTSKGELFENSPFYQFLVKKVSVKRPKVAIPEEVAGFQPFIAQAVARRAPPPINWDINPFDAVAQNREEP